jgi:hypothetical protein
MSDNTATYSKSFCERATDKALCVRIQGKTYWVPQSVIHDDSEVFEVGHRGKLVVQQWWAVKNKIDELAD